MSPVDPKGTEMTTEYARTSDARLQQICDTAFVPSLPVPVAHWEAQAMAQELIERRAALDSPSPFDVARDRAQAAYNLMLQSSWAAERCGASSDLTDCVVYLGDARRSLVRHCGVKRFDYTGPSFDELFDE